MTSSEIHEALREYADECGADFEDVKAAFLNVHAEIIRRHGVERAAERTFELMRAIHGNGAVDRKEAEANEPEMRYLAICWPDEIDGHIAAAVKDSPDLKIESVSNGLVTKGPDRGRVLLSIRMVAREAIEAKAPSEDDVPPKHMLN